MRNDGNEENECYIVVKNDEEQFSIWFEGRELPSGWISTGKMGSKSECLSYIKEAWIDMRPASLRAHIESRSK